MRCVSIWLGDIGRNLHSQDVSLLGNEGCYGGVTRYQFGSLRPGGVGRRVLGFGHPNIDEAS